MLCFQVIFLTFVISVIIIIISLTIISLIMLIGKSIYDVFSKN